jgi:hypothetical protein
MIFNSFQLPQGDSTTRGEFFYGYEEIAMAKDRLAGSRHGGKYGISGLGPGAVSDMLGLIDLGIHGNTPQLRIRSGMGGTREQSTQGGDRCLGSNLYRGSKPL